MTAGFLLFLGVGRLFIYLGQKFIKDNAKNEFIKNLFSCDLCLGVWIYTIIAWVYKINIDVFPYVPFLSALVTGSISSFGMHLLSLGWHTKYDIVVI